jgi:adenosine deaminase
LRAHAARREQIVRRTFLVAILIVVATLFVRVIVVARDFSTVVTAVRFEALRSDHTALRAFLRRMPKGGDLHVHLSGAVYAERIIAFAVLDGLCVRLSDLSIVAPPCRRESGTVPAAETQGNQALYDRLVNSLSMRFFLPLPATPSGHDQFFATFARFGLSPQRAADMVVDQLAQYQADGVQYVEFMLTFLPARDRQMLGQAVTGQTDFAAMLDILRRNDLDRVVDGMRKQVADLVSRIETTRDCGAERAKAGCQVDYRFIAQVGRDNPIEDVFVQTAAAAALVRAEPRVVALNFVQPEDQQIARHDYRAHMRIVEFLAKDIPVALHAGELWLGLVPPEDLTFHITDAVAAGARRIGHGTALAFEHDVNGLLQTMRRQPVAIEISLTSSDLILGVRGKDHPLPAYLAAGVPVVLATDDAGVSRIDLTNEYVRAARDHGLGYRTLKAIARNALLHSFLPPGDKRAELARFDRASADFEQSIVGRRWQLRHLVELVRAAVAPPQ